MAAPVFSYANKAAKAMEFNLVSTLSPLEERTLGTFAPTIMAPWLDLQILVLVV